MCEVCRLLINDSSFLIYVFLASGQKGRKVHLIVWEDIYRLLNIIYLSVYVLMSPPTNESLSNGLRKLKVTQ